MHAIMTENIDGTWLIEIVEDDAETGTEIVTARLGTGCTTELALRTVAYNVLADNGYSITNWVDDADTPQARVVKTPAPSVQAGCTTGPSTKELITQARQQNRAALDRLDDGPAPAQATDSSEADEMLAISQTLALRALKMTDRARTEASTGGKDPKKNHTYMQKRAALDAHCEQLAHLMWTRKYHAAGHGPLGTYPSAAETLKYLRELAAKEA